MITEQMFVNEVRRLVSTKPDYIYPAPNGLTGTCSYLVCNTACLFGQVLSNLGITQEELIPCETFDISKAIRDTLKEKFSDISIKVRDWANCIQYRQDRQDTWKDALANGDATHPEVLEKYPV